MALFGAFRFENGDALFDLLRLLREAEELLPSSKPYPILFLLFNSELSLLKVFYTVFLAMFFWFGTPRPKPIFFSFLCLDLLSCQFVLLRRLWAQFKFLCFPSAMSSE